MNLTVRQWSIIAVLAAGFIIAAVIVARDPGTSSSGSVGQGDEPFDEVVWCQAAGAVSRWGGVLDGSAVGDDADDIVNLQRALDDGRSASPLDLTIDFARIIDLALLIEQGLDSETDLSAALSRAQAQTDLPRVEEAVGRISDALVECGHDPLV